MIILLLLHGTFVGTLAFQWTSSTTFPNGTRVNVCLGSSFTLPWTFEVSPTEQVIDVVWYQVQQNHEIPLAAYIDERFMVYADLGRPLHFVPNAGLQLSQVTSSDMGVYSVHVNLNGVDQKSSQTALVHEPEAPIAVTGNFQAYILPDTQFPVIDGASHLQLGCGHFVSLGEPPVTVEWRTPSGVIRNSTYNNGVFTLTLPNPIEGGNYTCRLIGGATRETCLQHTNLFHTVSTVYVDEITSSLLLQGNDIKWLREENERLTFELLDVSHRPTSCIAVKEYDAESRVHNLYLDGSTPIKVYCDQSTDNGGWTVIQRRQDGSVDFYRNWTEFENGFGNPASEYWIGLSNLHWLTNSRTAILRVDLMDFHGNTSYAVYNTFYVGGPDDNYRLQISNYQGTSGDSLGSQNNMQFSTYDRDHDGFDIINFASDCHGAWWHSLNTRSNLNGRYYPIEIEQVDSIWWYSWNQYGSLKSVEMKMRW